MFLLVKLSYSLTPKSCILQLEVIAKITFPLQIEIVLRTINVMSFQGQVILKGSYKYDYYI